MKTNDGQVTGSAADVYEEFFVPALFGQWAPRVADVLAPAPESDALDVACGTGVLTRELARRVASGKATGLDCNAGMLAVARRVSSDAAYLEGRAEALPFPDASFAAVGSQFGLMFFDDGPRALAEMWRVLKPGGKLAVAVWASLQATPGYAAVVQLLQRLFGEHVAGELRAPFCLGDPQTLRDLFDAAHIDVRVSTLEGRVRFPSISAWMHTDVRGWTLADKLDDDQYSLLEREAQKELLQFTRGDRVEFDGPAHLAWAQKPA
jgi:SAM-dependent methyltransferase